MFLCIGTDRATGDSLGPLIGDNLSYISKDYIYIYGTLDNPVHAKNIIETISTISNSHTNPLIIAIDACLGSCNHIGFAGIRNGPISPGSGVNKDLPKVGHISIIGIVNMSGFFDFLTLQSTRLSVVIRMAKFISSGIKYTIYRLNSDIKYLNKLPS